MIGILLLSLLRAVSSDEWSFTTPTEVTAQKGLCARIPCNFSGTPTSTIARQTWVWINDEDWSTGSLVFDSKKPSRAQANFRTRTHLSGSLEDGDCSLFIDSILWEDEGPYLFGVESGQAGAHEHSSVIRLRVSNFTDKPQIFPVEIVEGKPVSIKCIFETVCRKVAPSLTWETLAHNSTPASNSLTWRGDTIVYTSVLTLTPTAEDEGRDLSCIVTYQTVSSRQTITLTMADWRKNAWKILLIEAGIITLIALAGFLTYKYIQRRAG